MQAHALVPVIVGIHMPVGFGVAVDAHQAGTAKGGVKRGQYLIQIGQCLQIGGGQHGATKGVIARVAIAGNQQQR